MASGGNRPELFNSKHPRTKKQTKMIQSSQTEVDSLDNAENTHLNSEVNSSVPCQIVPDSSTGSVLNGHSSLNLKNSEKCDKSIEIVKNGKYLEINSYDQLVNGVIDLDRTNHTYDAAGQCTSLTENTEFLNSGTNMIQTSGGARPKVISSDKNFKQMHKNTKLLKKLSSETETKSSSQIPNVISENNSPLHNNVFSSRFPLLGSGNNEQTPHKNDLHATKCRVNGFCNQNRTCLFVTENESLKPCIYGHGSDMLVSEGDIADCEETATDLIDEGAVCDFDKLVDWHNVPPLNDREENSNECFRYLDSVQTVDNDMADGNIHVPCSSLNCDISGLLLNNCGRDCNSAMLSSGSHNQDSQSNQQNNLCCDKAETPESCDDTGDFIDADLPDKALRLLSSSVGSSPLSSSDEDEIPVNSVSNPVFEENNLSVDGFSLKDDDDQLGNNCCSQKVCVHCSFSGPTPRKISSESDNDEDTSCAPIASFVNSDNYNGEGASGYNTHTDDQNHHGIHSSTGGSEHSNSMSLSVEYYQYITASSGSVPPLLPTALHPGPPGSASCPFDSEGMSSESGVNNLSQNMSFPVNIDMDTLHNCQGYYCPSNFQNDESNRKQKVFLKIIKHRGKFGCVVKRDKCRITSTFLCEHSSHVNNADSDETDKSFFPDTSVTQLTSDLGNVCVNSESGVSEPIYEVIESLPVCDENANMAAASESTDYTENVSEVQCRKSHQRSALRRRDRRPSNGGKSGIEKVMIWKEYEAYVLQVKQIGTSACGPTAVLNVLRAFDITVDKDEVCKRIHTNLREESAHIPQYLFSRAVAGTTAEDLLHGIESLTDGKIRGRFFHFWPSRDICVLQWLGQWMKKGAVPFVTLNLQKGVKPGWTIPDAWHHQMVYGVSSKGLYLTNPLETVPEEVVMEQLVSKSVLLVRRQDIVDRHRDTTDLGDFLRHPDPRWRTMNVLGQVINVLREHNMTHVPGYRAQLTSHISIPAVYKAGITLLVNSHTELWQELQSVSELPLREHFNTCHSVNR